MEALLAIVIPCYNEEEVIRHTYATIDKEMKGLILSGVISVNSLLLFVDDGSTDKTWSIIEGLARGNKAVRGLKLAGNAGHQNALFAGLMHVRNKCDCSISMDADLQDDTAVLGRFLEKHAEGYHVVYGIRNQRKQDTLFKRTTAQAFYRVMNRLGVRIRYNHADYRLLSNTALSALAQYREGNLFLRGIVPLLGFRGAEVYYSRMERAAGFTKYPVRKMISFAMNGLTSFSNAPIRLITYMGCVIVILSLLAISYSIYNLARGNTVSGWTSLMLSIWFIGGLHFIAIGVVGEYIGKIFMEVKRRPRYIIDKEV